MNLSLDERAELERFATIYRNGLLALGVETTRTPIRFKLKELGLLMTRSHGPDVIWMRTAAGIAECERMGLVDSHAGEGEV